MILAVVTVLYGIDIIGADVEAAYVVYAFIAVYVIVSIVLEIIKYKDSANGEAVQLSHCLTITNVVNRSPSTCLRLLLALDLLQQLFQLLLLPTLPQIKRICHCESNSRWQCDTSSVCNDMISSWCWLVRYESMFLLVL